MIEILSHKNEPRLEDYPLPPSTIITNFVEGESQCNYEIYLLELINESKYFKDKAKGAYKRPNTENHGECDAISENYELDFKLLASSTYLQSRSILFPSITIDKKGGITYGQCKNPGGYVKGTNINVAFRYRSLEDLKKLECSHLKHDKIDEDLCKVLNMLKVKKNIMLFFPFNFKIDNEVDIKKVDKIVTSALNSDFQSLFLYREESTKHYDTYFVTLVFEMFYIYQVQNNLLTLIEKIDVKNIPTFLKLRSYGVYGFPEWE